MPVCTSAEARLEAYMHVSLVKNNNVNAHAWTMVIMGFHFLSTKLLASPRYIPILDLHFYSDLVKYVNEK